MKVLGIIPARGGSKRIPSKNWKPLHGKPLIEYIITAAQSAKLLNKVVISTDAPEVLALSDKYPEFIFIDRPKELASDRSPAIDYVQHALQYVENIDGEHYDMIVILQPTSPLTLSEDIDGTIQQLIDSKADSAVSVVKLDHVIHPFKLKVMKEDLVLHPYMEDEAGRMADHEIPTIFVRNCAVYASKRNVVEERKVIGDKCLGYEMPPSRSIDINEQLDFDFAEFLLSKTV